MYVESSYILNFLNRNKGIQWNGTWKHRCSRIASTASTKDKLIAHFGSCKSPITVDVVFSAEKRLGGTAVDAHGRLILLESCLAEFGYCSSFSFHLITPLSFEFNWFFFFLRSVGRFMLRNRGKQGRN